MKTQFVIIDGVMYNVDRLPATVIEKIKTQSLKEVLKNEPLISEKKKK